MLSLVPAGSTIRRAYYRVPGHYGYGDDFDTWDDAVRDAQAKRAALVESLSKSLAGHATVEQIARTADVQTIIELRWDIKYPPVGPQGGASGIDTAVEKFGDVMKLRTSEQVGA
jgi:hypothetical protein